MAEALSKRLEKGEKALLPNGTGYYIQQDFNRATADHPVTVIRLQDGYAVFTFDDGFKPPHGHGTEAYTRRELLRRR